MTPVTAVADAGLALLQATLAAVVDAAESAKAWWCLEGGDQGWGQRDGLQAESCAGWSAPPGSKRLHCH